MPITRSKMDMVRNLSDLIKSEVKSYLDQNKDTILEAEYMESVKIVKARVALLTTILETILESKSLILEERLKKLELHETT